MDTLISNPPNIGVALSGGGYRSMLTGTGFILGMQEKGLWDCVSYLSGLSGGSWVLMDLIVNNFNITKMINNWDLTEGLLQGIPDFDITQQDLVSGMEEQFPYLKKRQELINTDFENFFNEVETSLSLPDCLRKDELFKRGIENPFDKIKQFIFHNGTLQSNSLIESFQTFREVLNFYIDLHLRVRTKKIQGFFVSFTDYWGEALLKRLNNKDKKFSAFANTVSFSKLIESNLKFSKFEAPIPIFVANNRNGRLKNVIFEFSPFEFGSWEKMLRLFVKLPYLGSKIVNGTAKICYKEFDDIGFITATSSSIFNNVLIFIWQKMSRSSLEAMKSVKAVMGLFGLIGTKDSTKPLTLSNTAIAPETDYAVYYHNPFFRYPNIDNALTKDDHLYLVDGGEDGENIPLRS